MKIDELGRSYRARQAETQAVTLAALREARARGVNLEDRDATIKALFDLYRYVSAWYVQDARHEHLAALVAQLDGDPETD